MLAFPIYIYIYIYTQSHSLAVYHFDSICIVGIIELNDKPGPIVDGRYKPVCELFSHNEE